MAPHSQVLEILAFFGSFWLSFTLITLTVLTYRYWRQKQTRELGYSIVMNMLQRGMTPFEIERVLTAWGGKPAARETLIEEVTRVPPKPL